MSELVIQPESESTERDDSAQASAGDTSMDLKTMRLIANGDPRGMQVLLVDHGQMLARLIGRLTAWHADMDDILQEVLLQIWKKADTFRGQGSLEGWLKQIAVNRCRNHFRALAAFQRKLEKLALLGQAEHYLDPPIQFDGIDDNLKQALSQLSQDERTTVVLFYLEQLSGDEVAVLTGTKVETVHVRLHRARTKLKKLIQQERSHE
jgi:RNA polymerase sigma factor (sigma-70 family)